MSRLLHTDSDYAQLVFEPVDSSHSLIADASTLRAICRLERQVAALPAYRSLCEQPHHYRGDSDARCCPPWSLITHFAAVTALDADADLCQEINDISLDDFRSILLQCAPLFPLDDDDKRSACDTTASFCPPVCRRHASTLSTLLRFVLDGEFSSAISATSNWTTDRMPPLRAINSLLPIARASTSMPLYRAVEAALPTMNDENVRIAAANFGVRHRVFDELIVGDLRYLLVAGAVLVALVYAYVRSLFLTALGLLPCLFALICAYFLYAVVLGIQFFPFLNLLALLVLVAIGADDVFIFARDWAVASENRDSRTLEKVCVDALWRSPC